ncbi:MAG: PAS domain S-box protein, partial [Candidatus Thermoplasmatota archaeon]|nr:PAS domain S-box protein [Candidatus Thermoplasmatota archaeon]
MDAKSEPDIVVELRSEEASQKGIFNHPINQGELVDINYHTIFNAINEMIIIYDPATGRPVDVNQQTLETFGWSRKQFLQLSISDLIQNEPPFTQSEALIYITKASKGIPQQFEWRCKKKHGELFWADVTLNRIRLGDTDYVLGTVRDISQQKLIEEELRKSKNHFQYLFDSMIDPVVIVNSKGKILNITQKIATITGYAKKEILGKNFLNAKIMTKKSKAIVLKNLILRMTGVHVAPYEIEVLTKDGRALPYEIKGEKIDYQGKPADMVILRDLSDRKQYEEEITKLAAVVTHTKELVNIADTNGKMIYLNKAGSDMLGISSLEVTKHQILDVIPENYMDLVKTTLLPALLEGKTWEGDLQFKNIKTKELTDVHAMTFPIRDTNNEIIKYFANVSIDITERKKVEKEIKEAHELLKLMNEELEHKVIERTDYIEKLLRNKDEFINQLGHDLKNPLGPLVNLLPILEKQETDQKKKELFEIVNRNVEYMRNLVIKTIELARLNSPNTTFQFVKLNLANEIEQIIIQHEFLLKEISIMVKNAAPPDIYVSADKLRLAEILSNILNNSIKYSNKNGSIVISATTHDKYATVAIQDTGIGMTPVQLHRVFDEFYKADESRHDFDSSGLGMSITKRIVEKHGGRIWVESPGLNQGTKVYFELKLYTSEDKIDSSGTKKYLTTVKRINFLEYRGKEILYLDYSNLEESEYHKATDELMKYIININKYNLLILTNVSGNYFTVDVARKTRDTGRKLDPYIKKNAIVGISKTQQIFL